MKNIIVFCFLAASLAFAQSQPQRIVVLPSIPDKKVQESKRVTAEQMQHLDKRIYAIATEILTDKGFFIVPEAEVKAVIYANPKYTSDCDAGGSCVRTVIEEIIKADFGTKLNVYMVDEQLHIFFELYGEKTSSKVINENVEDFAKIQAIIEKLVPEMFRNITKTKQDICQEEGKTWTGDDCKSELQLEQESCKEKGKDWAMKDGVCQLLEKINCDRDYSKKWIGGRCKSEDEWRCDEEEGKEWHNGVCRDTPERDCKNKSGMEWVGNDCITSKHAECLEKNHIWDKKNGFCRDPSVPIASLDLDGKENKMSFYAAVALDVIGAGFLIYGLVSHFQSNSKYDDYKKLEDASDSEYDSAWKDVTDAQSRRNLFYILGVTSLGLGVGVHIFF
jgi:hypothetical protein